MKPSLKAVELYNSGYNCAQSVLAAFCSHIGTDERTAVLLGSSFGGGVARMREICGAVSAMAMIIGIKYGYTDADDYEGKKTQYETVQMLADKFKAQYKSVVCRDLLGEIGKDHSPVPGERTPEYYSERPCAKYIYAMCQILDEYLAEREAENQD